MVWRNPSFSTTIQYGTWYVLHPTPIIVRSNLTVLVALQFEDLVPPPGDAVTALKFAPTSSSKLLVSSWDANVYLYDIAQTEINQSPLITKFKHQAPVLDVCFGDDDSVAYTASVDRCVNRYEWFPGVWKRMLGAWS